MTFISFTEETGEPAIKAEKYIFVNGIHTHCWVIVSYRNKNKIKESPNIDDETRRFLLMEARRDLAHIH